MARIVCHVDKFISYPHVQLKLKFNPKLLFNQALNSMAIVDQPALLVLKNIQLITGEPWL